MPRGSTRRTVPLPTASSSSRPQARHRTPTRIRHQTRDQVQGRRTQTRPALHLHTRPSDTRRQALHPTLNGRGPLAQGSKATGSRPPRPRRPHPWTRTLRFLPWLADSSTPTRRMEPAAAAAAVDKPTTALDHNDRHRRASQDHRLHRVTFDGPRLDRNGQVGGIPHAPVQWGPRVGQIFLRTVPELFHYSPLPAYKHPPA